MEPFTFANPSVSSSTSSSFCFGTPTPPTLLPPNQSNNTPTQSADNVGLLETPWRQVDWSEEAREALMKSVLSHKPTCESVSEGRVLLLGPIGAGKSSFISSVQSVYSGRVINWAMVGSASNSSFTKKLQGFKIHASENQDQKTGLVLCDVMGLGDEETAGLTLYDILAVTKGHAPDRHMFSPDQPVRSETPGYVKKPALKDRIHCVAFVVDASKILSYSKAMSTTLQQLRQHFHDLGVHQVALLTHVDEVCMQTALDASQVYHSKAVQQAMARASSLLGMPPSYIMPVKNYSKDLELDGHTSTLLLKAVDHILQYVDLYFKDNKEPVYM
ncbi:interferon-induced protein 44 [Denticeps clupeoides]|uniref:interferon-induced protein 44 n=1 Tax=Denticeps clupeoides TaxID=299321 RepID=UPI0010A45386|nr:interferon-induced protein 44-like [Denticeps clupeoides]